MVLRGSAELPHGLKCGSFGASSLEDRHLAAGDFEGRWALGALWRGPLLPTLLVVTELPGLQTRRLHAK